MTTIKQRNSVVFCEMVLNVEYLGDLDDFTNVSNFLYDYLDLAIKTLKIK